MAAGGSGELLREGVVYLVAAAVFVPIFTRLKLGAILGYLAAGIVIGPQLLGLVRDPASVLTFAELGVVLLLFVVGLELNPARLWALRRDIFGLGSLQILLCGLALTGVLILWGFTWQAALVVGLALALSSTALDVQILRDQGKINTPLGERIISVHLMQDLAIVPLLIVATALSRVPAASQPEGWELVWKSAVAIGGLVVAGRLLLNPLFRMIALTGTREVFVIGALLSVLGSAFLMESFGLSAALGAFIAGVMLADSPYRHEVEADIDPFRGLLLGLFFMAVGMLLDLSVIVERPLAILLLVALLMGIKFAIVALLARAFGSNWHQAALTGIHLSQGGEFAFVVLSAATAGLLILPQANSLFTAVVTLSMALTLPLLALWHRFFERDEAGHTVPEHLEGPEGATPGTVIVIGYGRFGQIVTQMLHARGCDVVLIDRKPDQIDLSRQFGWRVFYGDGLRPEVLRAAGAETARLLVLTTGGGSWDPALLNPVKHAFPHLKIIVRVHDRLHAMQMIASGQEAVVRELFWSAVEMGRMVLKDLGTSEPTIEAITAEYVRRDSERLALQVASGDIMAGRETIFRPGHGWSPEPPEPQVPLAPSEAARDG
jgi:glutathione-regulated potassium-efflux system protein KefB